MTDRKTIKPEDAKEAMEFYCGLFHPLNSKYNLDEITRYVFKYCQESMTDDEQRTTQYLALMYLSNAITNQRGQRYWQNQAKKIRDERVELMLKEGEETFLYRVKDRLMSDYGNKLLNLCPQCGALTRTAQAKQCQECFYNWHN